MIEILLKVALNTNTNPIEKNLTKSGCTLLKDPLYMNV